MIRLLIADDEKLEREALADMVSRRFEHEVVLELAENGRKAADTAVLGGADLILMDMKMPNLDGIDATRIIRELAPDIPIIALTAYAYEHDKQAALKAGCNDFLTKPFTQEVLKETIKKWLDDKG